MKSQLQSKGGSALYCRARAASLCLDQTEAKAETDPNLNSTGVPCFLTSKPESSPMQFMQAEAELVLPCHTVVTMVIACLLTLIPDV